ncbi:MAG TPA: hypothetical protein VL285_21145 [Bryobacteraceae bacterium]|nr:hypothetical protein [Bryobacteraceae bacterium]
MKKISLAVVCAAMALMFASPRRSLPVPNSSRGALAFRVTFGEKRTGVKTYDGSVHTAGGRLLRLAPWRFFGADRIAGADSWKLEIKRGPIENQPGQPVLLAEGAVVPQNLVTAGILVTVEASTGSATFRTAGGTFTVPVAQLRYGRPLEFLDGDVRVERAPEVKQLSTEAGEQHDYPALAVTRSGGVWFAWQAYRDGGDHVYARAPNGALTRLTENRADVFRPSIAEDAQGRIHVVWCERSGEEWHLVERVFSGQWSERARVPDAGTPNFYQRLAASPGGRLHMVWVGHEAGESYLYTSSLEGDVWSRPMRAAGPGVWRPDAAVDARGTLHVAWDSYQNGNYDIFYRSIGAEGAAGKIEAVTTSPRFEAHASIAIDHEGRPWLAWDESGANWGKDWNHADVSRATTLYAGRAIQVAVRSEGRWMQSGEFSAAASERLRRYAQAPRLAADGAGRMWALFQMRTSADSTHDDGWATGGLWDLYLSSYENGEWRPAALVPNSTGRPEAPFEIAGARDRVWTAWAGDGRTYTGKGGNHERPTMVRYDVFAGEAAAAGDPGRARLSERVEPVLRPQAVHNRERQDIGRVRAYRTTTGGVEYRILRGDFHRHTEISYDGAGDGSVEDYYRYMIDAGGMDTGIIADHNMGGDMEYNWWRTEKSYDLFRIPGRFLPLFGYERSVRFPNGHRNVVFDHRGVRTLPVQQDENQGKVNSGRIVYPYLRQNRGICMEHSLATNQGTDYRDNDPNLEPLVEIYQGYHASYEYPAAPRAESDGNQLAMHGPFQPAGFWWNALARGLKLGVHASSDHISTHCSYAMIFTPSADRTAIVENMRRRHAYAATDNIILDFQAEDSSGARHLMGEAFSAGGHPRLRAHIAGTGRIAQVDLARNNQFVYNARPAAAEFDLDYYDQSSPPGENYYYVRVIQEDGNLAWSSPIWIAQR